MCRSITIARTDRTRPAAAIAFCLLAAIPLLAPHSHEHASPGARTAFQLLASNPAREIKLAVRAMIVVITVPFAAR